MYDIFVRGTLNASCATCRAGMPRETFRTRIREMRCIHRSRRRLRWRRSWTSHGPRNCRRRTPSPAATVALSLATSCHSEPVIELDADGEIDAESLAAIKAGLSPADKEAFDKAWQSLVHGSAIAWLGYRKPRARTRRRRFVPVRARQRLQAAQGDGRTQGPRHREDALQGVLGAFAHSGSSASAE